MTIRFGILKWTIRAKRCKSIQWDQLWTRRMSMNTNVYNGVMFRCTRVPTYVCTCNVIFFCSHLLLLSLRQVTIMKKKSEKEWRKKERRWSLRLHFTIASALCHFSLLTHIYIYKDCHRAFFFLRHILVSCVRVFFFLRHSKMLVKKERKETNLSARGYLSRVLFVDEN